MLRGVFLTALVALWLAVLFAGGSLLLDYQGIPGSAKCAMTAWPADSSLRREAGRSTVLLFVHPHCPCTQASIDELTWILTRTGDGVDAWVVFIVPEGAPLNWERGHCWEAAGAVPGLRRWIDLGGAEARRFGAATSGQVSVFAPDGSMVFNGGITGKRGHRGDNPGRNAAREAALGRVVAGNWPVFGCSIFDQDSDCAEGESK